MQDIEINPQERRIMMLAKKIAELYSVSELEKLAPISPQTIHRWAEEKHRPSKSAASALPAIIAVSDQDYNDYLNGTLTLDDLWEKKGSAKRIHSKQEITLQTVLNDAKMLSTLERLKLMSNLWLTLAPSELAPIESESKIEYVELFPKAKARLKSLLSVSNAYRNQTTQSIIERGANKAFVEDIIDKFDNDYIDDAYQSLLPFICLVDSWAGDIPIITQPSQSFESVQSLLDTLNAD